MPTRDDPRWSIRVSAEEDARVKRIAQAMGCSPAVLVRACVGHALAVAPVDQLEARVSALRERVPAAAAPVSLSSQAPVREVGASSPPASRRLLEVVAERLGNPSLARREIALGRVKVGGAVSRNFDRLVADGEVELDG